MTLVMGVLNVTPDSFSDGGAYADHDAAIAHALELVESGADIVGWFNFLVRVLLRIRDIQPCAGRVKSRGGEVARFAINLTPFRSISAPEFSNQFKVIQATSSPHPPRLNTLKLDPAF